MKKNIIMVLLFFLMFVTKKGSATTGCLVGSTLYTSTNGGTYPGLTYYDTSPSQSAAGYCLQGGTTTTPCQLRTWYWFFWSNGASGVRGEYGPEYCPIDDYVGLILVPIAGLGFLAIRKRFFIA